MTLKGLYMNKLKDIFKDNGNFMLGFIALFHVLLLGATFILGNPTLKDIVMSKGTGREWTFMAPLAIYYLMFIIFAVKGYSLFKQNEDQGVNKNDFFALMFLIFLTPVNAFMSTLIGAIWHVLRMVRRKKTGFLKGFLIATVVTAVLNAGYLLYVLTGQDGSLQVIETKNTKAAIELLYQSHLMVNYYIISLFLMINAYFLVKHFSGPGNESPVVIEKA